MIEQLAIYIFLITFGVQIGRVLTLHQQAKKTVEGIEALMSSPWYGPASMTARLHCDQEATGDMPPPLNIWAPPARMPVWLELQYHFERWRVPRLRRVG